MTENVASMLKRLVNQKNGTYKREVEESTPPLPQPKKQKKNEPMNLKQIQIPTPAPNQNTPTTVNIPNLYNQPKIDLQSESFLKMMMRGMPRMNQSDSDVYIDESDAICRKFENYVKKNTKTGGSSPNTPQIELTCMKWLTDECAAQQKQLPKKEFGDSVLLKKVSLTLYTHNQNQMRQKKEFERDCLYKNVPGRSCSVAKKFGWTMKEYIFLEEAQEIEAKNIQNTEIRPCFVCMCNDVLYQRMYIDIANKKGEERIVTQQFSVIVDVKGEYSSNIVISAAEGVLPVPKMNLDRCYEKEIEGIKYLIMDPTYYQYNPQNF